jgi:hypothetical protein
MMDSSTRRKLTIALLVVAAGLFTARGPVRAYMDRNAWADFAGPYVEGRLLAFGTLLVLSILPVYHRIYDTLLLLVPVVWLLGNFAPPWRTLVGTLRILMALFLLPSGSALIAAVDANRIPQPIQREWWWNSFVMPHQIWLLLAISVGLLLSLRKLTLSEQQPTEIVGPE